VAVDRLEPVPEDWQRALAIVAHPDDLEYGASSAVAKWTMGGKQITYLLATRGEAGINAWSPERTAPVREAEERESALLVGVKTVEFLNYRDGVVEYGLELRKDLARAMRRYRPEVIITSHFGLAWPGGALNQADHRAVGMAACDAARDAGNRWIFPELLDEGLEPWSGARWVFVNASPDAGHACDVSDALVHGIASLRAHHAYFENLGTPFDADEFLRNRALEIGKRLGCLYAVEFLVLRL
jgi:LmbE family N-acetylglucosaminyl deacetylase